jgi:hypothetical protein
MRIQAILLFCSSLALSAASPVLVLSFDGLSAAQFTPRTMPRFWKLGLHGQRGEGLPPFPATTFNGHATLATGCWPEHHGIVANGFVDPALGFVRDAAQAEYLQREPLWVAATRSGVRTAVYHWPCATGPWEGVSPWRLEAFQLDTPDRAALVFSEAALKDGALLVMAYLSGTDTESHLKGPASREVRHKLAVLDQEVAPWVKRMLQRHPGLRVLLLADHGMAAMTRRIDLRPVLGPEARVIAHGGSAFIYPATPMAPDLESRLAALDLRVWRPETLPGSYHLGASPRIGSLVVEGPLGSWISGAATPGEDAKERKGRQGAHGYDAADPRMHTWLVALGTGRHTPLPPTPLWNLAPTVAHWLNIKWAMEPDGIPVPELETLPAP